MDHMLAQGGWVAANAALFTFLIYIGGVFVLAWASNRLLQHRSFLAEYFLGSRSLGMWAFAFTFAATSASGGSFTGFPSKIYMHGWILALWIASYMVVPICTMGFFGRRLNQVGRISGAITIPDVLRDRFDSRTLGAIAVMLIVFFTAFNLVAQFKSGSEILRTLLRDVTLFQRAAHQLELATAGIAWLQGVNPDYLLCLGLFAVSVIAYTTYGGFHAVVWTDVMQGVVMVIGVVVMLPLALWYVGGLDRATRDLAQTVPPRYCLVDFEFSVPAREALRVGTPWLLVTDADEVRLLRIGRDVTLPAGLQEVANVPCVEIAGEAERRRILESFRSGAKDQGASFDQWLARNAPVGTELRWLGRDANRLPPAAARIVWREDYLYGAGKRGVYVEGPGPRPPTLPDKPPAAAEPPRADRRDAPPVDGFLPLGIAISFFFMWAISGSGQPAYMVRLMAFKSQGVLWRGIMVVTVYFGLIYFPLVVIFTCARLVLPGMELESDRIMPQMAVTLTGAIGHPWIAGLLVAAPFAAVMSTVDSFLLLVSSGLVRDIYQRNINPDVSQKVVKRLSYGCTLVVGAAAMLGAVNPPRFLQDIIVYTGSGLAACFLAPMVFALYWPRTTRWGAISGMVGGFAAHLAMYLAGWIVNGSFYHPCKLVGFDPVIVGLAASFVLTYAVSLATPRPSASLIRRYFMRRTSEPSGDGVRQQGSDRQQGSPS